MEKPTENKPTRVLPKNNEWLRPSELAPKVRTTTQRLANDRYCGRGFPYAKNGANVLYHWPTCEQILKDQMVYPAEQP